MRHFINPFTDYGFKKIFGQEVSKDLLIDFLNDLLVGERVIKDITFLNNEQLPDYREDRGAIYDIYCTTDTGEKIIVEMQNRSQVYFKERALYYLSRAVAKQGEAGNEWKFRIKAVYGVFFMNFLLEKNNKLRTDVILADWETGEMFSDKMRQIFIALPCFAKTEDECETDFERWIFVLKNMEILKRMPFKARKAVFQKLEELADVASLSTEERERYDNSVRVYRDYLATMDSAKEEGRYEGREEGRKEGREEGRKEGREEGKKEGLEMGLEMGRHKEKIEIAKGMKSAGIPEETISQITKLAVEEIRNI